MPNRPETLSARVAAALDTAAATAVLSGLYYECYGQPCHQRPRLLHFLAQYLTREAPVSNAVNHSIMPYKFKEFAKDFSAIVTTAEGEYKEVHAGNLTTYDAEYLIADGKGHLLEQVTAEHAEAVAKYAKPVLSTRTEDSAAPAEADPAPKTPKPAKK